MAPETPLTWKLRNRRIIFVHLNAFLVKLRLLNVAVLETLCHIASNFEFLIFSYHEHRTPVQSQLGRLYSLPIERQSKRQSQKQAHNLRLHLSRHAMFCSADVKKIFSINREERNIANGSELDLKIAKMLSSVVCHLEKLMMEFIKHKKVIKRCTKRFRLTTYHAQFLSSSFVLHHLFG